jgi:hypothetical protein
MYSTIRYVTTQLKVSREADGLVSYGVPAVKSQGACSLIIGEYEDRISFVNLFTKKRNAVLLIDDVELGRNRRLFDKFDKEFMYRYCGSPVVDWKIEMNLSTYRGRVQV